MARNADERHLFWVWYRGAGMVGERNATRRGSDGDEYDGPALIT